MEDVSAKKPADSTGMVVDQGSVASVAQKQLGGTVSDQKNSAAKNPNNDE